MRLYLIIGAAVAIVAALTLSHLKAYQSGVESERTALLERAVQSYVKRENVDNEVSNMDLYRICRELGGLHDDCSELRVRGLEETPGTQ
jgi:hypothetical protein